jgi:hypothetical protein
MIAKISSSNNLYGALSYNHIKVDEKRAKIIFAGRMIENANGKFDMHSCLQSFEPYLLANKRTEKPVLHISINPDPKDVLDDNQLSEIAQIYMQKMGYGDQPYIVYMHEDIERRHIHIVSLRVDENGKKIDHNFEHRRSMDVCRDMEQQYGLIPANQKQKSQSSLLSLKPVDYKSGDIKHQIVNVIRPITRDYYFLSLKEYRTLLTLYNIGVEEVRGDINGKEYKGLVYSALNKKGEKTGTPFKSSLFGKSVGIEALEKRMEQSAEIIKNKRLKERSKKIISTALLTSKNRADFEGALAKQSISVLFRGNEQGRIYGSTFIDHEQKCLFNGSRLGKEFSANVFNELFNGNAYKSEQQEDKTAKIFEQFEKYQKKLDENSNFGGILDIFMPENSGNDDIEEQNLTRKMKKKKKKQRKI